MTNIITPSTELDQYQEQLISNINAELLMKQQQILSQNLSRMEFTTLLKTTMDTVRDFTPKMLT